MLCRSGRRAPVKDQIAPWPARALRAGWLLLVLLTSPWAVGQVARPWYRDPVLSPLLIRQMVTDSAGFRWVATDEGGVYRYDGNELLPLKSLVRQGAPVRAEPAPLLALDRAGRLWLGTVSGLFRFDPATGRLLAVPLPLRPGELPRIKALRHDPRTDRLWVGYGKGALAVLAATHPQRPLFPVVRVVANGFYFTIETGGGGVWLTSDDARLYHLAPDGSVRRQVRLPAQLVPVPGTRPLRFFGPTGLFVLDSAYRLRTLCRWPRLLPGLGYTPYVTDSTLDVLADGQWLHIADVRGPRPRLSSTPVAGLAGETRSGMLERDAYGTWWRYTHGWRGCYKQRQVRQVVEPVRRAGGGSVGSARLITRLPDGRLFVSTYRGFLMQAADSPTAPLRPLALGHMSSKAPYVSEVGGIYLVPGERLAVLADENFGVARFDLTTQCVSTLAGGPMDRWRRETNGPNRAYALLHDRAGRLWVGGEAGLFQVSADFASVRRVADERADWPLHKLEVTGLAEDSATGALWISTNGGLFWLPPNHPEQLRHYVAGGPAGRTLPTDALTCVAAASPGRVWVGTLDQGLLLVDARRGVVRQLSVNEGLPSLSIATVLPDRAGNIWVGTYAGLVRYAPASGQLAVFGKAEGLDDTELNRRSAFADADGTLWFGGVGGVYRVRPGPAQALATARPARLLLTALGTPAGAVEAVQYLPGRLRQRLTLAAGPVAFVELRLALMDFFAPGLVRYAYRLHYASEAQPTAWLSTPQRLVLRGLSPGDYEVEIRAESANGQQAANRLRIPLHAEAHWWQWPVVWALAAGLLVALGYGLYWLQLRRALRTARLRAELAANLHDEMGALLTRVNLLAEVLRDQYQPAAVPGQAGEPSAFDRLLLNSRAAAQTIRDVVWGIDSRADSAGALVARMQGHLDQSVPLAGLAVQFRAGGLPAQLALPPAVRQHLYLIFKEAITNALRHAAGATELCIRLEREANGQLTLEILDDGPHAPRAGAPAGMGLRNMRQRAAAIGATLETGPRPDGVPGFRVWVQVRVRR